MSDSFILLLVLAGFYLHDCSLWLERDTVAFFATGLRRWRPVRPHPLLSGTNKGLLLSFRLPPLTPVYLSHPRRIAASPTHVCPSSAAGAPPTAPPISYDAIHAVAAMDSALTINGTAFARCQEPFLATMAAESIRRLLPLSPKRRDGALAKAVAAALDPEQLETTVCSLARDGFVLRVCCNTLFLYLFLGLPVAVAFLNLLTTWLYLLAILVVLTVVGAVEFRRLHAARWPADRVARRSLLIRFCFFPPLAMRAYDLLAHRIAAHFHPIALALVLGDARTADQVIRQTLRQLRHPLAMAEADPVADATQAWFRKAEESAIRALLIARGLPPDEYLAPPKRPDTQSLAYCPRCETPYAVPSGLCSDCPGVVLQTYPPSPAAPSATTLTPQVSP
jgi:hypothetical protein